MLESYGDDSVIEKIRKNYESLFLAEKKIADYILGHGDEVVTLNVSELAKRGGSSEATVVRMCKHVGYQGYYQMRLLLARDLERRNTSYDENEILDTPRKIFEFSAARIAALSSNISLDLLLNVTKLIRQSRRVYVVGAGNTSPVASDLGFRLERYGIPCSYDAIPEHFLNHVSLGKSDDMIIAISRSGASRSVIQALQLAKKNGMHSVVISAEKNSQLAEEADYVIHIADEKDKMLGMELDCHLLEMAVSDAILYVLCHLDAFAKNMQRVRDVGLYGDDVELLLSEYKL